ncbi:MAG: hypothetical protein EON54_24425, partial [Alcaligenaceae bacterium]
MPIDPKAVIWDAPAKRSGTSAEFAKTYGPVAERIGQQLNVDPNVVLGQLGLETGWGKSIIPNTYNLGNIKDFSGGGVGATDSMTGSRDKYRAYKSVDDFADDYVSLIQRKYPSAVGAKDPQAFATALKSGGYAEDPRYVDKVVQASRMTSERPNQFMQAAGKVVGALLPSAQAGTRIDPAQVKWDSEEPALPPRNPSNNPSSPEMLGSQAPRQSIDPKAVIWDAPEQAPASVASRIGSGFVKGAKDTLGGLVRGAGSIGATLLAPGDAIQDAIAGRPLLTTNKQRRASMDGGLQELGADTGSLAFGAGKLTGEIAGTAGTGNVLASGAKAMGAAPRVVNALASGGMNMGEGGKVANALLR